MKVECKGEDEVESTWEVSPRPNRGRGENRRRRGSIYSQTPSSRCSSSWGRTWLERRRRQDRVSNSVTASDAAIFGARRRRRVHLCTRRSRRGHLWPTRGDDVANAGISLMRARKPTRVSL